MNKETRGLIWGIISVFICGKLVGGVIHGLISNLEVTPIEWFGLPLGIIGLIFGSILIFKAL